METLFIYLNDYMGTLLDLLYHSSYNFIIYITYYTWLSTNYIIFNIFECPSKLVMERTWIHADKYMRTSLLMSENQDFTIAPPTPYQVFIAWKPLFRHSLPSILTEVYQVLMVVLVLSSVAQAMGFARLKVTILFSRQSLQLSCGVSRPILFTLEGSCRLNISLLRETLPP